jgi:hypothetical protein
MSKNIWIFYRNFLAGKPPQCHIGLGNNALLTCKVLRSLGYKADLLGVWTAEDIEKALSATGPAAEATDAIIEAAFIDTLAMRTLMFEHPSVHFVSRCHSQIGFLQVEAGAVRWFREYGYLQDSSLNFSFSANSLRFCTFWRGVYNQRCLYLPNLYFFQDRVPPPLPLPNTSGIVRIGSFGSMRLLKNHTTSAAAAMLVARRKASDLEFYVNINREEQGKGVHNAIQAMFANLRWAKLIDVPWESWAVFRQTIQHMDLCLQPSFTETFNICSADAAAEGTPSVVSAAIEWCPPSWTCDSDDAEDVARIAYNLLGDPHAGAEGLAALTKYEVAAEAIWKTWLGPP